MQTQRAKEQLRTYTGLVMIGTVVVLWIGVVLLMAEVHKNARPGFIVLGAVITLGLGYAYYDYSWKEHDEKTGLTLAEYDKQPEEWQGFLSGERRQPSQTTVGGVEHKYSQSDIDNEIARVRQEKEQELQRKNHELKMAQEDAKFWKEQMDKKDTHRQREAPASGGSGVVGAFKEVVGDARSAMTGHVPIAEGFYENRGGVLFYSRTSDGPKHEDKAGKDGSKKKIRQNGGPNDGMFAIWEKIKGLGWRDTGDRTRV